MTEHDSTPTAVATRYFDAWKEKDLDAYEAVLAEDVEFIGPMATLRGARECRNGFEGLAGVTTDIVVEHRWVDGPDVLTWFQLHTSVADAPMPVANWSHVEDGKITRIRVVFDPRPMLPPS